MRLTYRELAVRLGVSVEAARRRALRGKWRRMPSNNGMTLVMPPDDLSDHCAPDVRLTSAPDVIPAAPDNAALVSALEGHVATLKEQLAAERERADRAIGAFAALAERLDALAKERAKPWWRRLVG